LKSQHAFLCQAFPSAYPSTVNPPSLETLAAGAQEHARAYLDLLLAEIGQFPMAVKAQRMLTVPLLYECREQYDVRVLLMTRDLEDQVNSTLRVWARSDSQEQRSATPEFVRAWIEAWLDYGDQVRAAYDLPYYQVAFERLIADPVGTMQDVSRFLDIPCPPAAAIEGWINKDLVNRPTFSLAHLKDLLRHRVFKR